MFLFSSERPTTRTKYKDFNIFPRWQEFPATAYHPRGLSVKTMDYYGYVDRERKEFDFTDAVSLLMLRVEEERDRRDWRERSEIVEDFWNHLPHRVTSATIVLSACFDTTTCWLLTTRE
jgi:hypothetical protein